MVFYLSCVCFQVTKRMSAQRSSKSPHARRSALNVGRNSLSHSVSSGKEGTSQGNRGF